MNYKDEEEYRSRTAVRNEKKAAIDDRRRLLEAAARLPAETFEGLDLASELEETLNLMRKLKPGSARNRLVRRLARRGEDHLWTPIEIIVDRFRKEVDEGTEHDAALIEWRERLLTGGNDVLDNLLEKYPYADRQQLRNLLRVARKTNSPGQSKGARSKLLRTLRQIVADADGD